MYLCLCGIRSGGVRSKRIGSFDVVNLRIDLDLHKCIEHRSGLVPVLLAGIFRKQFAPG